ncbi:MAG: DUF3089 domain-containing protein [Elusimicrobiota bacterium]|jgi:hypothetical protein|nr:DUF3089 domain-containing protein [Elusimicrobiota bacterium]
MEFAPAPDYSNSECWALRDIDNKRFDIFYIYPTFYGGPAGSLMNVYNTPLKPAIKNNVIKNCGIFSGEGNIYAPLYRQASFASLGLNETQKKEILKVSLSDVTTAFQYYLQRGKRRPFVLAGHSQGSRMLREMMKLLFKDAALSSRLIAAYLIGAEITFSDIENYPWLKVAKTADDTGIIITYNTQAAGIKNSPIYERGEAVCVNPLNWSAGPADKELNQGAVFFDGRANKVEEIPFFTSAYIEKETGSLIASDVNMDKYSSPLFQKGIYHVYDYEFFYRNLQNNFKRRLKNYFNKRGII